MFRVTRYPMISKTESGRVGYRKKCRVAARVRVPAGHCIHHLVGQVIKDNNQDVEERNAELEGDQYVRNQLRRRLSHRGVQLELHPAGGALRQLLLKGQRGVFHKNLPKTYNHWEV